MKLYRLHRFNSRIRTISKRALFAALMGICLSCQSPPSVTETAETSDMPSPNAPMLLTTQSSAPVITSEARARQDDILPPVNPLQVRGDLAIAGSNAMAPLVEVITERFIDEGFSGELAIERVGSGTGFELFCNTQQSDIAMASQTMTPQEEAACQAAGRRPVALQIGTDALAIVVSQDNRFLSDITRQELRQVFTAEYWSDIRTEWPSELIRRTIPETGSGALNLFVEEMFDGDPKPLLQTSNTDFFSEDEDYLVQALAIDPFAAAFFSYSYYVNSEDTLKLISVDGARPTDREDYSLVRPLLLYVDANDIDEKPQIVAFLNFFLTYVNEEMATLGYFPLEKNSLDETKRALLALIGQSIDEG